MTDAIRLPNFILYLPFKVITKNIEPLNEANMNKAISLLEAFIPVLALVAMLAFNVYLFGDDALSGSNQFVLLLGAAIAAIIGFRRKVSYEAMLEEVSKIYNLRLVLF